MKLSRWCPLVASISAVFLTTISTAANANDNWWFDVEVIAFKRNVALTELEEQFSLADNLSAPRAQADIISDIISPDISYLKQGLAVCGADTSVKWPSNGLLSVPAKDVDFLSLPKDNSSQYGDMSPNSYSEEAGYGYNETSGLTANEPSLTPDEASQAQSEAINGDEYGATYSATDSDYSDSLDYSNEGIITDDATPAPDAATIASYWTSFFGVKDTSPITVPAIKYCEEAKPWLSAEVTTALNVVAPSDDELNSGVSISESKSRSSALQPVIVWKVNQPDNRLPAPASLPIIIEGHDWPLASKAHLLTNNQQALSSISRQIRSNRELERLFHATWRQPVMFGKNKAFNVRLYGGQNYAQQFDMNGDMREQKLANSSDKEPNNSATEFSYDSTAALSDYNSNYTSGTDENSLSDVGTAFEADKIAAQDTDQFIAVSDIFADLNRRLSNPQAIEYGAFKALDTPMIVEQGEDDAIDASLRTPIWEIDGTIKVFLKYINRVPYLHVDSEMFYRQPVPLSYFSSEDDSSGNAAKPRQATSTEYKLVSVPLAEQRRVISTQLHYFDHPLFGFVVQIRRYNRPDVSE
ncbi:CsiV family protein [Alteromonas abrolhosensis]|uniref:CsiV family protein n=1 Tax=Alteromonas abrolhosensis TaxID=1892904 RepID=UPI00096B701A|nr:CsiV family protein [Alteromonas abrolhosensis]